MKLIHLTTFVLLAISFVPMSFARSLSLKDLRRAAERGDAIAQNNLGNRYYNGEGVVKDYGEAVKWHRRAAEQGLASAQFNLGVCYENGEGVKKDADEAVKWYRRAAEQGDVYARKVLEELGVNSTENDGNQSAAPKKFCSSCGARLTGAGRFCSQCGAKQ